MELLWMILPLLLVFCETKRVIEVKVELGQTVILNCSVDISNMHWYLELHSQLTVCILRTYGEKDNNPTYCSPDLKTKYSVMSNRLVITNVTAEDCRIYFCARMQNNSIHFEDTIRLVLVVSISPSTNVSESNNHKRHMWGIFQNEMLIFSSFGLNAFMLFIIIGLSLTSLKKSLKKHPLTSESPETLETPQYEEIHLRDVPPSVHTECIYYKAQLPQSIHHLNVT
ncbi:hypothetical protein PAMP_016756 [Pampus punctatissimus]